jgi:glycosyltransferase involved in cell wall biosynthesis
MSSWRRTVVHLELGRHWTGGAQQVLLLAEGLQRKAVPTWLVCPKEAPLARRAQRCGLPVLSLPWRDEMNPLSWLRLGQWLRHLNPPPLLHLHSRRGLVGACVLARALRIPLVVHWRTITPMPPLVLQVADAIIAISDAAAQRVRAQDGARWKVVVIRDAVDASLWTPFPDAQNFARQRWHLRDTDFVAAAVGRLIPDKGYDCAIDALAKLPPEERPILLLAGEGPQERELRRRAIELGVGEWVRWLGFQDEVRWVLWAADVFIHPSRKEGLSCAILEAMAAGLPVIAASVGGVPEVVRHGMTGWLVPPDDPAALAEALRLLRGDEPLRHRLSENAQRFVRQHHHPEKLVIATLRVYERLAPTITAP